MNPFNRYFYATDYDRFAMTNGAKGDCPNCGEEVYRKFEMGRMRSYEKFGRGSSEDRWVAHICCDCYEE
jgi:hypothetical protein